ncbi:MAG: GLUG motif-containing protein [Rhizomicrobium sp.]
MDCELLLDTVRRGSNFAALIVAALIAPAAQAAVTISSATTQNMSCSNDVCTPTAAKAVLNAGDLETLLASGSVEVTTTGTGVQAKDITIKAPLTWSSGSVLTLDAHKSIAVDRPISIAGLASLVLNTNDGGRKRSYIFGKNGNVSFANLSSRLTINGVSYTLVDDLKTLASDIAANPSGNFALANNYDASQGGSYSVTTTFTGTFEGLGNVISNFAWEGTSGNIGLFAEVGIGGNLRDIGLINANLGGYNQKAKTNPYIGTLAGFNFGTVLFSYATGTVVDKRGSSAGGLVGVNEGTIRNSHAAVAVSAARDIYGSAGGLVGGSEGIIIGSYATGAVSGYTAGGLLASCLGGTVTGSYATGNVRAAASFDYGGGLVGRNDGAAISDSYATGAVSGGQSSHVGGLIGENEGTTSFSYSTGVVSGEAGSLVGGLIGDDEAPSGSLDDTYWDTDTSGITNLSQGAGNIANDPGITGLTTAQFQSGLPAGFDPKVWAEQANLNGGLPYLLANPPPRH